MEKFNGVLPRSHHFSIWFALKSQYDEFLRPTKYGASTFLLLSVGNTQKKRQVLLLFGMKDFFFVSDG
jgi:hypothetical protein